MGGKEKAKVALQQLETHLERSGYASATVMRLLPGLQAGQEIGMSTSDPEPGSQMWEMKKMGEDMQREEEERKRRAEEDERRRQQEQQKEFERRNEKEKDRDERTR